MAEYKTDDGKLKEVCSILKALLTSYGGELPMNQIDAEYNTVVGKNIPYKELKHGTLASFLQSIPGVLKLENRGGKLVAQVVNDENIDLILHQVRNQNNSKMVQKKKHTGLAARQLHANNPNTRTNYNTRWHNNVNWHPNPRGAPTMPMRPKPLMGYSNPQHSQWRPRYPRPEQHPHPMPSHPPPGFQSKTSHPPLPQPQSQTRGHTNTTSTYGVTAQHTSVLQATTPTVTTTATTTTTTTAANKEEIYKINLKMKAPTAEKTPAKKSFKQQLMEAVRGLEAEQGKEGGEKLEVEFKTVPCGKKKEWCSVILIGSLRVSSYPNMTSTEEEAEEAASQKALEVLLQHFKNKQVTQLPITSDPATSVSRVKQLLKEISPNKKIWWEAVQEQYCEAHKERLPHDWMTTVRAKGGMGLLFDNLCADKWTVALAEESRASQSTNTTPLNAPSQRTHSSQVNGKRETTTTTTTPTTTTPPGPKQLPPLALPTTPTWDVFITCMEDGNNVQLLLVGSEYSMMYNELLTEMELHYMEDKNQQPVKQPVVGGIYVASHEESWLRVKLMEISGDKVKVKFVDHGDMEEIPKANLYVLQDKFFSLPPQALRCCLAGLEDAPQEAVFQALIECLPMGKTLVARVQRRQEPYAVILFDTSTDEDINLNEKVLESLAQHMVEPSLPSEGGIAEVYLTHASTDGTLYIQVESKTYKILEDLLNIAKRRTEEMLGEKVQVDLTKLYLARYSKDGEWYRATPRTTVDVNGKVLMRFVDFGNSENVPLTNIRGLQKMSPFLAKVPHQALACRLHDVPSNPELRWTMQTCQRLLDLASPDSPLLLKVVSEGIGSRPPSVQLFKRLVPQNELVSINDTLCMDTKLFGSEGDSNNNSVEKEVVVSQFRSQQSSCASGVTSHSLPSELPAAGHKSFLPCSSLSINDIPDVGSFFDVYVTYAANPYHFAVQPWKMGKKYNDLCESMQDYYSNPDNLKHAVAIESGQNCAIKHTDHLWYRAKVERVVDGSVTGTFVDFGDCFFVQVEDVQPLTPAFCTVPCLAIKAELFGIKAANKDWNPEDACRFRELAGCKNLVSKIRQKKMTEDGSLFLSLELIDTADKTVDTYIDQLLVDEHRAFRLK